jgi:hypothetical protein
MAEVKETALGEQPVDWGQGAPAEPMSREQILAELAKPDNPEPEQVTTQQPQAQTPPPAPVEQPRQAISPVQPSGQTQGTENSTPATAAPTTGQPQATQAPALTETQVQDILDKKHIAPQDTWKLAKMYQDAQRELTKKSMEAASLKKIVGAGQPVTQPITPPAMVSSITGLPYSNQDPNAQLLEDLQQNPILTLRKVAELAYGSQVGELTESLNEQKLHNTVVKLSTSPETAEFNLQVVQDEIKAVIAERPELAGNLAENLPVLNDLAIGRLYRAGKLNKDAVEAGKKIAEQNIATRQAAAMEAGNKATPQVEKTFDQMSSTEQRAHLLKQFGSV